MLKLKIGTCSGCRQEVEVYKNNYCRGCSRNRSRLRRAEIKSLGLCFCGRERDSDRTKCKLCRDKSNKYYREAGTKITTCVDCKMETEVYCSGKICRRCSAIRSRKRRLENREKGFCSCGRKKLEGDLHKCERCRSRKISENRSQVVAGYRKRNAERFRILGKLKARKLKIEVLKKYGGEICICCQETTLEFLTLDHINGGGNKHRKEVKNLYRWIVRNNFPPGFQVLCMNCNFAKGKYGYCPHGNIPEALPPKPEDTEIPPLAPAPHRYQL